MYQSDRQFSTIKFWFEKTPFGLWINHMVQFMTWINWFIENLWNNNNTLVYLYSSYHPCICWFHLFKNILIKISYGQTTDFSQGWMYAGLHQLFCPLKFCHFLTIDCKFTFRSYFIQSTTDGKKKNKSHTTFISFSIIHFTQMYFTIGKKRSVAFSVEHWKGTLKRALSWTSLGLRL